MLKQTIALVVAASLAASGCASTARMRATASPPEDSKVREAISEYAQRLPIGSRIRIERARAGTIAGTLISAGPDRVVVQRATRIPEPPVEIALDSVTRIELEERSNVTKIVLFGAAAGAAATLGFLLFLAAALGD